MFRFDERFGEQHASGQRIVARNANRPYASTRLKERRDLTRVFLTLKNTICLVVASYLVVGQKEHVFALGQVFGDLLQVFFPRESATSGRVQSGWDGETALTLQRVLDLLTSIQRIPGAHNMTVECEQLLAWPPNARAGDLGRLRLPPPLLFSLLV